MLDKLQNCEECDEFECTCFCKCGLPNNECVCGFTEEDYMTLPDKLTKRIQELVPEITELKEGCKIFTGGFSNHTMLNSKEYINQGMVDGMKSSIGTIFDNMPKLEILGRDINLEDVLSAMNDCEDIEFNRYGNFIEEDEIMAIWVMNKPLQEQSKECIEFLYKLLVTDK